MRLQIKIFYLVIIIISTIFFNSPVCALEANAKSNNFYFVQISDTHIGKGSNLKITQRLIQQINKLPMDIQFVIHSGDIMQNGLRDTANTRLAVDVFNKLEAPIYFIPGNHDIYPEFLETEIDIFQKYFGELIFTKEFEEISFIGFFSDPIASSFSVVGYEPLIELERAIKLIDDKPIVVIHHIPSVDFFYNNIRHDGWKSADRIRWEKLLNSYNVIAIIAGHFHGSEQYWIGDIPLYISGSVTNRFGRQPSFRIYKYEDGKLSYRTQYETQ